MILEMDLGNSRIKWRLLQTDRAGVATSVEECFSEFKSLPTPKQVRLASVRRDDSVSRIGCWTMSQWSIGCKIAVVTSECSGVHNLYSDPGRLGVDRWLAMLAGYHLVNSACVIVDSGTALTVDALDSSGWHLGGYIVPGFSTAVDSLQATTGIRVKSRNFRQSACLGASTEQAVLQGILNQGAALIEKVVADLARSENRISVLLSGGDADLLHGALSGLAIDQLMLCPNLVLDGLALAHLQDLV